MQIDIDEFYEDYLALKAKLEPLLPALEAMASGKPNSITITAPVAAGKEGAAGFLERGDLASAGAALGLQRVTKASGHGFDETDESYEKRLLAEVIGAAAADAQAPQPAPAAAPAEPVQPTEPPAAAAPPAVTEPPASAEPPTPPAAAPTSTVEPVTQAAPAAATTSAEVAPAAVHAALP